MAGHSPHVGSGVGTNSDSVGTLASNSRGVRQSAATSGHPFGLIPENGSTRTRSALTPYAASMAAPCGEVKMRTRSRTRLTPCIEDSSEAPAPATSTVVSAAEADAARLGSGVGKPVKLRIDGRRR